MAAVALVHLHHRHLIVLIVRKMKKRNQVVPRNVKLKTMMIPIKIHLRRLKTRRLRRILPKVLKVVKPRFMSVAYHGVQLRTKYVNSL